MDWAYDYVLLCQKRRSFLYGKIFVCTALGSLFGCIGVKGLVLIWRFGRGDPSPTSCVLPF